MSDLQNLPSGNKWYSYSGLMSGGPTLPATVEIHTLKLLLFLESL